MLLVLLSVSCVYELHEGGQRYRFLQRSGTPGIVITWSYASDLATSVFLNPLSSHGGRVRSSVLEQENATEYTPIVRVWWESIGNLVYVDGGIGQGFSI